MCHACYEYQRIHGTLIRHWGRISFAERVWRFVDKDGPIPTARPELGPCWLWTGGVAGKGYGLVKTDDHRNITAHRAVWKLLVDPDLPQLTQLDHLCLVKRCVRPSHLEPVTNAENMRRAAETWTHCRNGHDLSIEGYKIVGGKRFCAHCYRNRFARFYARQAAP